MPIIVSERLKNKATLIPKGIITNIKNKDFSNRSLFYFYLISLDIDTTLPSIILSEKTLTTIV